MQPVTVPVTITNGNLTLYVDDFMSNVPPYGQQGPDELAAIPYAYTVG